ncbi:MAG: hypothetical protein ACHQ03_10085 [Candidatus Bathyarchaeia archaeon]
MPFKKKHGHALTYVGLFFLIGVPLILTLLGGFLGGAVAGGGALIISLFGVVGIGVSSGFGFLLLVIALIVRCVRS